MIEAGYIPAPAPAGFWRRVGLVLAIALPVLAGLAWMAHQDAPRSYLLVNALALCIVTPWVLFGRAPEQKSWGAALVALLLAGLLLPLIGDLRLTSESGHSLARWIALGPVTLHSGALFVPPLVVLASRLPDRWAAGCLLIALAAISFQIDPASGLALTLAAAVLAFEKSSAWLSATAIAGLAATIFAFGRGELTPQLFVEAVLPAALDRSPSMSIALGMALLGPMLLPLLTRRNFAGAPAALAACIAGFVAASLIGPYPSILIGYGAAPILGSGLAAGFIATGNS